MLHIITEPLYMWFYTYSCLIIVLITECNPTVKYNLPYELLRVSGLH